MADKEKSKGSLFVRGITPEMEEHIKKRCDEGGFTKAMYIRMLIDQDREKHQK